MINSTDYAVEKLKHQHKMNRLWTLVCYLKYELWCGESEIVIQNELFMICSTDYAVEKLKQDKYNQEQYYLLKQHVKEFDSYGILFQYKEQIRRWAIHVSRITTHQGVRLVLQYFNFRILIPRTYWFATFLYLYYWPLWYQYMYMWHLWVISYCIA